MRSRNRNSSAQTLTLGMTCANIRPSAGGPPAGPADGPSALLQSSRFHYLRAPTTSGFDYDVFTVEQRQYGEPEENEGNCEGK